jgi:hypothetical protein
VGTLSVFAWLLLTANTYADSPPTVLTINAEHMWTVQIGKHPYGLIGFHDETWLCLGPRLIPVRMPFFAVVGIAATPCLLAGVICSRKSVSGNKE